MIARAQKTILITDDTLVITHVLRHGLQRAGYRVLVAANGEAALLCANAEHPDLLILDVELPDISGFELLRQIRNMPDCAELPVIFITGSGDPKIQARAHRRGAAEFFPKPISLTELQRCVQKLLGI